MQGSKFKPLLKSRSDSDFVFSQLTNHSTLTFKTIKKKYPQITLWKWGWETIYTSTCINDVYVFIPWNWFLYVIKSWVKEEKYNNC